MNSQCSSLLDVSYQWIQRNLKEEQEQLSTDSIVLMGATDEDTYLVLLFVEKSSRQCEDDSYF